MKDSNRMIHYLGFECVQNGGRRLQFSVDTTTQTPMALTINISGEFFTGVGKLSFQEAASLCRTKLRQNLVAGTLRTTAAAIELTSDDVAQFREAPKGRRS